MKLTQAQVRPLKVAEFFIGFTLIALIILSVIYAIQSSQGTLWD